MADPLHFEAHAAAYEQFRPPYPEVLWTRLRDVGVLRNGLHCLELGAGTGEATIHLVDSGSAVTAVEPGRALAARLRRRVPDARVIVDTAEAAALPDAAFDLAVIATAVHWLDLETVVPNLHRVLRPGGQLAVWRTVFGDPEVSTPFRQCVTEIVALRDWPQRPSGLDSSHLLRELTVGGYFTERHSEAFRWSIDLNAEQIRGLFSTFSDWTVEEVDAATQAVNELGGRVTEHYVTPLIVMDRAAGPGP